MLIQCIALFLSYQVITRLENGLNKGQIAQLKHLGSKHFFSQPKDWKRALYLQRFAKLEKVCIIFSGETHVLQQKLISSLL